MQISKTDFLHFLRCPNSFWLEKRRPEIYPHGEFTAYAQKLAAEGYEVEAQLRVLLEAQPESDSWSFQSEFRTERGLYARVDALRSNADGTVDLCEVKSSTSVKRDARHNQVKDAAFQVIAAEDAGSTVSRVFIVHLNGGYVRAGNVDPEALLVFADVTDEVREIEEATRDEVDEALAHLAQPVIDESHCSCLEKGRANHCDAFVYFNRELPSPSIYDLPRISSAKLKKFVAEGRFGHNGIGLDEVTAAQTRVLRAAQAGASQIDHDAIASFYSKARYPLYFLDYETYSSAIPLIDGARPQSPIPFQFSLHLKRTPDDDELLHAEYLAEEPVLPRILVECLAQEIGPEGSVVSWHSSFENTQNRAMAELFPDLSDFLHSLIERALDLEDLFKDGYVDIAFGGSTSIKKVLPVLAPDLTYEGMAVASGTDAMEAWARLISMADGPEKDQLRTEMLEYCKLDTYAMVRIFEGMERL
ncbi:MAG: DUF2779 domain-containing protein [Pseudomonadota bacterium]